MVDISVSELSAHDCSVVLNITEPISDSTDVHPVGSVRAGDIDVVALGEGAADVLDASLMVSIVRVTSKQA